MDKKIDSLLGRTLFSFNPLFMAAFALVFLSSAFLLASPYYKFAFFPALTTIALFILAINPRMGFLFIVFLVPFDAYTAFLDTYPFLTLTKFIGFWLVVVLAFVFLLKRKEIGLFVFRAPLWKWLWAFMIINLISALLSDYHLTSFYGLKRLLTAYVVFGLSLSIVSYDDFINKIPLVIIVSNAIGSILSILGYFFHLKYFAIGLGSSKYALERASGLSVDPNFLAMTVLFSIPFVVQYIFVSEKKIKKVFALILLPANILTIILSYSRGGALALMIIAIMLGIAYKRYFKPRHFGFLFVLLCFIIVSFYIFAPASYKKRLGSLLENKYDSSVAGRLSYIDVAKHSILKHPFWGTGPMTFPNIYADSKNSYKYLYPDYRRAAHDVYIEILVGTGSLGFAFFVSILFFSIKSFFKARSLLKKMAQNSLISIMDAYLLSFFALIIYFFMLSRFYNKYFWLLIALSQLAVFLSANLDEVKNSSKAPILGVSASSFFQK